MNAHEVPDLDPQPRDAGGHVYVDFLASDKLSVARSGRAGSPTGGSHTRRTRSIT